MVERKPLLSVIICSLRRTESLHKCLDSLSKQSIKNFEIIIIDETNDPGKGLAAARDVGWRQAKSDLVAWIDDDVVVSQNWVNEIITIFSNNPQVGGVSGPTIIPTELLKNRLVFWWYKNNSLLAKTWIKIMLDGDPYIVGKITKIGWWTPGSNFKSCLKIKTEVDYLEACNMTLRRKLVEKVGGFDLKFKGTSEWCEVDLAMRIKKLGIKLVFDPKVRVDHHVSKSGVYKNRWNILERLINYSRFYFKHVIT
jgi:GT2 family glycosyltransferase